jgi:hypothetical protein
MVQVDWPLVPSGCRQSRDGRAPVSATLELPDGSLALVRLTEALDSQPGAPTRSFTVSIELPGDSATMLTATLTIRRVDPLPTGILAEVSSELAGLRPITVAASPREGGMAVASPPSDDSVAQPVAALTP